MPVQRLSSWDNNRLGLHMHVVPSKDARDSSHTISIDARDRNILLPKWRKLANKLNLPKSMMYKLPRPPKKKLRRCYGVIRCSDGREFTTQHAAARAVNISPCGIQACLAGRQLTAGGYGWEYIFQD